MRIVVLAILVAGCHRHHVGTSVTTLVGTATLDGGRVRIGYHEQRSNTYQVHCIVLGERVEACQEDLVETERGAPVGAIVVDVQTGDCSFDPTGRVERASRRPRTIPFGDRTFAPVAGGVRELLDGREVAIHHAPHTMTGHATWYEPRPWPVGAERHGFVLAARDGELWLVRDADALSLGRAAKPEAVLTFDDAPIVVAHDIVLELGKGRRHDVRGLSRVGWFGSQTLIEVAGLHYASNRNGELERVILRQDLLGSDGRALVFHRSVPQTLAVFDLASRSWRVIPYAKCTPQ